MLTLRLAKLDLLQIVLPFENLLITFLGPQGSLIEPVLSHLRQFSFSSSSSYLPSPFPSSPPSVPSPLVPPVTLVTPPPLTPVVVVVVVVAVIVVVFANDHPNGP